MAITEVQLNNSVVNTRDSSGIPSSSGVRRCLFGPVNHAQIRTDLRREMRTLSEEGIRRWNFDFERETPLKGKYSWYKLETNEVQSMIPSSSISLNPRICISSKLSCTESSIVDTDSSATITTTTTTTGCVKPKIQENKIAEQNPRKRVAITNKITEFLKQKKPKSCTKLNKDSHSRSVRRQARSSKPAGQMRLDKFLN